MMLYSRYLSILLMAVVSVESISSSYRERSFPPSLRSAPGRRQLLEGNMSSTNSSVDSLKEWLCYTAAYFFPQACHNYSSADTLLASDDDRVDTESTEFLDPQEAYMFGKPVPWAPYSPSLNFVTGTSSIVGGVDAQAKQAPFFVMFLTRSSPTTDQYVYMGCGGTLLSNRHVLTAAHCVAKRTAAYDAVYVNAYQPFWGNPGTTFHFSPVDSYLVHPSYVSSIKFADMAIATLEIPVDLTDFPPITPAYSAMSIRDNDSVQVYGFGRLNGASGSSPTQVNTLQVASMPYVSKPSCKPYYSQGRILDDMICGGNVQAAGPDACYGDSGGPMVTQWKGRPYQVGVVSWGSGCGQAKKPGVYSSMQYHFQWIQDSVCGDSMVDKSISLCKIKSGGLPPTKSPTSEPTPSPTFPPVAPPPAKTSVAKAVSNGRCKTTGSWCLYGGECCSGVCNYVGSGKTTCG